MDSRIAAWRLVYLPLDYLTGNILQAKSPDDLLLVREAST